MSKKQKNNKKQQIAQKRAAKAQQRKTKRFNRPADSYATVPEPPTRLVPASHTAKSPSEEKLRALLGNVDIIDEPEFEVTLIDPVRAVNTYIEAGKEMNVNVLDIKSLPVEERDSKLLQILEKTCRLIYTDQVRYNIVETLTKVYDRFVEEGRSEDALQQVEELKNLYSDRKRGSKFFAMTGLVRMVVFNSIQQGGELMRVAAEMQNIPDTDDEDSRERRRSSLERGAQLLAKSPVLSKFFEEQSTEIIQQGMLDLYMGRLYLELYTDAEIEKGVDMLSVHLEKLERPDRTPSEEESMYSEEEFRWLAEQFTPQLRDHLETIITRSRIHQMHDQLDNHLKNSAHLGEWARFIFLQRNRLARATSLKDAPHFFMKAFLGEMHLYQNRPEYKAAKQAEAEEQAAG